MSPRILVPFASALLLVSLAPPAGAQDAGFEPPRGQFSSLINIDALIDNHCRMLARRYNLTNEQEDFTRQYLHAKADEFLGVHRDRLFTLADELFAVRAGAKMEQNELVDWGKSVMPLYEEAKRLIVDGNEEWREILTDEQRLIHDEDVRQMYESFRETEDQLARIVGGEMTVEEFRKGPRPRSRNAVQAARPDEATARVDANPQVYDGPSSPEVGRAPQRLEPRRNPVNRTPRGARQGSTPPDNRPDRPSPRQRTTAPARGSENFEGEWEKYVREFCERFQLGEAHRQKAQAILKTCQEQAKNYMQKRTPQIEQIDERIKKLNVAKNQATQIRQLQEQKAKLLEPVGRIFEHRLKPQLERLLTPAQREELKRGERSSTPDRTVVQRPPSRRTRETPPEEPAEELQPDPPADEVPEMPADEPVDEPTEEPAAPEAP